MEDLEQVKSAFMKADAAGDTANAKILHDHIVQMQTTPSKPQQAPAQPQQAAPKKPGAEIAKSGIEGMVFGAATPEILTTLGAASMGAGVLFPPAAPLLEPLGAALTTAGTAARAARGAAIIGGMISGLGSETAGQVAEGLGAGKVGAGAARLAGAIGPSMAGQALLHFAGGASQAAARLIQKLIPDAAVGSTGRAVKTAQENMRATITSGTPEHDAYIAINKGIEATQKAAQEARASVMEQAHAKAATLVRDSPQDAKRIVDAATKHGDDIVTLANKQTMALEKAAGGKLATAARVKATAAPELDKVGPNKTISEIGEHLRGSITQEQQQLLAQRAKGYAEADAKIQQQVAQKEAQGRFPQDLEPYKQYKAELEKKLLITPEGQKAAGGKETIGDPTVRSAYQRIYDVITTRKLPDANGKMQEFKTTSEALQHLERNLNEKGYGAAETGFGALGQKIAQKEKAKIRGILSEYIGPEYSAMKAQYAEESGELGIFGTKGGKAATAVSRVDPKSFMTDAANVPKQYFQTKTGVKDLLELTGGNTQAVHTAAESFSRHEMEGMSSKQAKEWIRKASDWMPEVPGLKAKTTAYANQLERIESTVGKLGKSAERRTAEAAPLRAQAGIAKEKEVALSREQASNVIGQNVEKGKDIVGAAEKSSSAQYKATMDKAQVIGEDGFKAEEMRKFLFSGDRAGILKATRALAGVPGGQEAMAKTVRLELAKVSPYKLENVWSDRIREITKEGGFLSPAQFTKLDADVQAIIKANRGPESKKLLQTVVEQALRGTGALLSSTINKQT